MLLSVNHVGDMTPSQQAQSWIVQDFVSPDSLQDPASLNQQSTLQTDIEDSAVHRDI